PTRFNSRPTARPRHSTVGARALTVRRVARMGVSRHPAGRRGASATHPRPSFRARGAGPTTVLSSRRVGGVARNLQGLQAAILCLSTDFCALAALYWPRDDWNAGTESALDA